jgi:hypothetical protein
MTPRSVRHIAWFAVNTSLPSRLLQKLRPQHQALDLVGAAFDLVFMSVKWMFLITVPRLSTVHEPFSFGSLISVTLSPSASSAPLESLTLISMRQYPF